MEEIIIIIKVKKGRIKSVKCSDSRAKIYLVDYYAPYEGHTSISC